MAALDDAEHKRHLETVLHILNTTRLNTASEPFQRRDVNNVRFGVCAQSLLAYNLMPCSNNDSCSPFALLLALACNKIIVLARRLCLCT